MFTRQLTTKTVSKYYS